MTPGELARVDRLRAGLLDTLKSPCDCGECLTDDQLRTLLACTDEELLGALRTADAL